jgi:Ca2+-binding EF-hand superfamily protein
MIKRSIAFLSSIATIVSFDLAVWPAFGCIVEMKYENKMYLRTLLPFIIGVLMRVPVVILKWRNYQIHKNGGSRKKKLELKKALLETRSYFWNNILTWLFLVYPTTSLTSLQAFSCVSIGGVHHLLVADMREECPTRSWGPIAIWSVFASIMWAIGVPVFSYIVMLYHKVPQMARAKQVRALANSMIDSFMDDTLTSSVHTLATFLGHPAHTHHGEDSIEFQRRSDDMYMKIFPEHSLCENKACEGHQLPEWLQKIMHELDHPQDMEAFRAAVRRWFERIDEDLNGTIDRSEIRTEFQRLGQTEQHADFFLDQFDCNSNAELDIDEFEHALIHSLDTSIPGLSAVHIITLWSLFLKVDENGDGKLDIEEFEALSKHLTMDAFSFTGMELFESLTAKQLVDLRNHRWATRDRDTTADLDEGETSLLDSVKKAAVKRAEYNEETGQPAAADKNSLEEESEATKSGKVFRKLYTTTVDQHAKLEAISIMCKETCRKLEMHIDDDLDDETFLPEALHDLRVELSSVLKASIGEHLDKDPTTQTSTAHIQLYDHTHILNDIEGGTETYSLLLEVIHNEELLKKVLAQQVEEVAWNLKAQGVISHPPLEWDGSLGPDELLAIFRLGFLLNAYQVSCWYWEIVEMVRKLLLTGILVVAYDGSPSHLAGSLLTVFLFLVLHLQVDPYLNRGLNEFQRLILLSQFFTIFSGIMYILMDCLNDYILVEPDTPDSARHRDRNIIAYIIIVVNFVAAVLFPACRVIAVLSNSKATFTSLSIRAYKAVRRTRSLLDVTCIFLASKHYVWIMRVTHKHTQKESRAQTRGIACMQIQGIVTLKRLTTGGRYGGDVAYGAKKRTLRTKKRPSSTHS